MHHPTDRIAHTTAFVTPVMEHWLEREIAQWVHPMKDQSDDPSRHERTLLPREEFDVLINMSFQLLKRPHYVKPCQNPPGSLYETVDPSCYLMNTMLLLCVTDTFNLTLTIRQINFAVIVPLYTLRARYIITGRFSRRCFVLMSTYTLYCLAQQCGGLLPAFVIKSYSIYR